MNYETKENRFVHAFVSKGKGAINEDDHSINFVVSTDVVDRDDEIVMADAVYEAIHRKDEFYANPICPPCHKPVLASGMPPCVGHWETDTAKLLKHRVEMRLIFDMKNKIGTGYWDAYSGRHMRAVSIGFGIVDGHEDTKDGKRILIITEIELYEISCVGVGANQQALAKLKALGCRQESCTDQRALDQAAMEASIGERIETQVAACFLKLQESVEESFDEIKSILIPDSHAYAETLLGEFADSDGCAGDDKKAERIMKMLKNLIK